MIARYKRSPPTVPATHPIDVNGVMSREENYLQPHIDQKIVLGAFTLGSYFVHLNPLSLFTFS